MELNGNLKSVFQMQTLQPYEFKEFIEKAKGLKPTNIDYKNFYFEVDSNLGPQVISLSLSMKKKVVFIKAKDVTKREPTKTDNKPIEPTKTVIKPVPTDTPAVWVLPAWKNPKYLVIGGVLFVLVAGVGYAVIKNTNKPKSKRK